MICCGHTWAFSRLFDPNPSPKLKNGILAKDFLNTISKPSKINPRKVQHCYS
jgi:hypothetical protein